MTITPIDGWCQCGYRRSAHKDSAGYCPLNPPGGSQHFRPNPGSDTAEAMHELARAKRAAGEQTGLDL